MLVGCIQSSVQGQEEEENAWKEVASKVKFLL